MHLQRQLQLNKKNIRHGPAAGVPGILRQRPVDLGIGPQRVPAVEKAARAVDASKVITEKGMFAGPVDPLVPS